ncbi:Ribonuclease H domain [Macleaya cordata]|uniref:Ribonuclease H domain n=1 Tax=Macleaya cordata TaxID=56857 RepID=A0A200Q0R2_MACCD|nr:Ribonuclease H domain [Macleaya cordata]
MAFRSEEIAAYHTPRMCSPVTHLLYADDTIIFLNGRVSSIRGCMEFLDRYCSCSGQRINTEKSSFLLHSKAPSNLVSSISHMTGYQRKSDVMVYLGAPIYDGRIRVRYFDDLLSKIRHKLAGWKANFLTQGGKLIMIRHVLSSMAIYLLSAVSVPTTVLQKVDRVISNFFWGSHEGKPKRKWVSWNAICKPVSEGGLGVRNVVEVMCSFRLKALWNAVTSKSVWSKFICAKYGIHNNILPSYTPPRTASKYWKECAMLLAVLVKNSAWKVGQGNMNFWYENWSNDGILAESHPEVTSYGNITLREAVGADFNINGLPSDCIPRVKYMYDSRLSSEMDVRLWASSPNGVFSIKSAFHQIRESAAICPFARFYWVDFIPKKLAVLFWRVLHNAVPVDVRIQNCAISLASACVCCGQRQIESLDHLLFQGNIATALWDHFAISFGLHREDFSDFRDFIWAWFHIAPVGSQLGSLASVLPLVIVWEIWSERNCRRHNAPPASIAFIRFKVLKWVHFINPLMKVDKHSPSSVHNILGRFGVPLTPVRRKPLMVLRWSAPPPGYFLLNTDGTSAGSLAAGGGVIRDNGGNIVAAFHSFYGPGTNNLAESRALLDGLLLCRQIGVSRIAVRVDSKLVASWFHYNYKIPWTILRWWNRIRDLAHCLDLVVGHVYRELNAPADAMASLGYYSRSDHIFLTDFPPRLVGLARLDRMGIPYIRNG